MLSEMQIEEILRVVNLAWMHNKCPKYKKTNFLLTVKSYITESGMREDVCPVCLGSGRKEKI